MILPKTVTIYEVGPRDGLQSAGVDVATEVKIDFVDALSRAGLPVIEATSFVSPKAVPALADADDVMAGIERRDGVRYAALVPNEIGLERALAAGVDEVAVFTAASETFNQENVKATIPQTLERFRPVAERALQEGLRLRGYVSTAFGCPYEGEILVDDVEWVAWELFELGCHQVSLGDTIGVADPEQVRTTIEVLDRRFDIDSLALHMHDTYGRGLANVVAGLQCGISTFDTSAGGIGGCPFAPGATGNLATEDLVSLLEDRLGIETGVDLDRLLEAGDLLAERTDLRLPSRARAAIRAKRRRQESEEDEAD